VNLPVTDLHVRGTYHLIPSRFPTIGVLDQIASPSDLDAVMELESWTNDRICEEMGILHRIPRDEWVTGKPFSTVIMAAFCHPSPEGNRFNTSDRGAWYASMSIETAHAEVIYHRTAELEEVGVLETFVQVRAYIADFRGPFHDLRTAGGPADSEGGYSESQRLATRLFDSGSNGLIYYSVQDPGGENIACFRPSMVRNPRAGGFYEYRWAGSREPSRRKLD